MLAKESSIILTGAVYAFFALTPGVRRPIVGSMAGMFVTVAFFALHPVSVALSGHVSTTKAYLVWQLVRRPNHPFLFYFDTVPSAVGPLVLLAAFVALVLVVRRRRPAWRAIVLAAQGLLGPTWRLPAVVARRLPRLLTGARPLGAVASVAVLLSLLVSTLP